ncbi:SpoIIE family protein phosphatase [Paracrocinitomix mangrovi]|uniref:SpoIIE family protein phosphatase n=1 Tax=Paracrocinitomix mangrovi TaxID=2862509 RepID=UPI001C8D97EF|nr:SpoIIE family protein phosphatase [Paracrocinitomix mangrovi]UKN03814.1 SpoIIE family protein phosphatase [Paracrocinitomix mangrovi]
MRTQFKILLLSALFLCPIFSIGQVDYFKEFEESLDNDSLSWRDKGLEMHAVVKNIHFHPEQKMANLMRVWPIVQRYNQIELYWQWHNILNLIFREQNEVNKAIAHGYKMLEKAEEYNNPYWKSEAYNNLYATHVNLGMTEQAKGFLIKAQEQAIITGDSQLISTSSYYLGYAYYSEFENDSAIYFLEKSVQHRTLFKTKDINVEPGYLLARTFMRDKQFERSITILLQCAEESKQIKGEYYSQYYHAGPYMYISNAYAFLHNWDSAVYYMNEAFKEYKAFDEELYIQAHYYCGSAFISSGNEKLGLPLMNYLLDSTDFPAQHVYPFLAKAFRGMKQHEKAYEYYDKNLAIIDSVNKARIKEMSDVLEQSSQAELAIQKQMDEKKQQLAEEKTQAQKQQKNIILLSVAFVGILILIFARILFKRYKIIKEQKEEIQEQKMQVEEKNEEILDSINYAKKIQDAILPPDTFINKHLKDAYVFYKPKDVVAGDFYWIEEVGDHLFIAAADCTGHGVPGAMVSVVCHNALNRAIREFALHKPAEILDKTKELVIETFSKSENQVRDGMDIALMSLSLADLKKGGESMEVNFAGANNPLWIIRKDNDDIEEIKGDKQPVGFHEESTAFTNHIVTINKGDLVYLFTDGYADQFGGDKGKKMKNKNFKNLLVKYREEPVKKQHLLLETAFEKWKGEIEQLDDVCVIGARF